MLRLREESLNAAKDGTVAASSSSLPPPAHTGISVTRTFKVGDKLMMRCVRTTIVFLFISRQWAYLI